MRACVLRRVQFDRRELGVELVKDVDVMPIDPHESLPASLAVDAVRARAAPLTGLELKCFFLHIP
jgi:hypothetical protein